MLEHESNKGMLKMGESSHSYGLDFMVRSPYHGLCLNVDNEGTGKLRKFKKTLLILAMAWLFLLLGNLTASASETPRFEQPLLITSAGQSAEVQLAAVLAKRAALDYSLSKLAKTPALRGMKTLVLSLGASLKGLGAAGLDVALERDRIEELLAAAQKQDIPVLCMHLGGESRRGQLSDDFIATFLPSAKLVIVVKSGNKDGFFTNLCEQNKIPMIEVERAADALQPLQKAFSPEK